MIAITLAETDASALLAAGFAGVVSKPVTPREFLGAVARATGRGEA